ncbi:hypothetical protein K432DRAFT_350235 [Lepidopterella palustris CBS 459.81]|uniref:DUF1772-domain-containing protein n=1 Tax=Lepidopterella palustris CBS 459.81 TaxID=1314670 RepID=A0A8E2ED26_9PEZI|nr:hypothetical protein K432DRAFT_350235 [Lepidopterella palustris CBS 459.81]
MADYAEYLALSLGLAQIIGITFPALYTGTTFAYSSIVIPALVTYAPPKLLAKQWLQAYQFGPKFVLPLILCGTLANAMLAYFDTNPSSRIQYVVAAVTTISIMPMTLLYMEPGINGAAKCKVQQLLRDEGFEMQESTGMVRVDRHTAKEAWRKWAEKTDMKDIALMWSRINAWRWMITAVATVASASATCL